MKTLNTLLSALFGIVLLGTLIAGAYYAMHFVIALFAGLDAQVASIIYAAVVAVLFSAVIISFIVQWGQKQESVEQVRREKAAVYQRFLEAWSGVLSQHAPEDPQQMLHLKKELQVAEKQLLLWGSSSVVRSYTAYQKQALQSSPRAPAVLPLIEKVLGAMRRDLGHNNLGLHAGDLLSLLLDDSPNTQKSNNTASHIEKQEAHYARW
jgi:hypothetical protein